MYGPPALGHCFPDNSEYQWLLVVLFQNARSFEYPAMYAITGLRRQTKPPPKIYREVSEEPPAMSCNFHDSVWLGLFWPLAEADPALFWDTSAPFISTFPSIPSNRTQQGKELPAPCDSST